MRTRTAPRRDTLQCFYSEAIGGTPSGVGAQQAWCQLQKFMEWLRQRRPEIATDKFKLLMVKQG